jgi:hypothetical protein
VVALVLGVVGVGAQSAKTFSMPNSVLLFGEYGQLQVVTPGREQVVRPPVDLKYNGGYFAYPSLAPRGDVIAWGFAMEAWANRTAAPAVCAGIYGVDEKNGDFDFIGDTAFSADGTRVALVASATYDAAQRTVDLGGHRCSPIPTAT